MFFYAILTILIEYSLIPLVEKQLGIQDKLLGKYPPPPQKKKRRISFLCTQKNIVEDESIYIKIESVNSVLGAKITKNSEIL